MSGILGVWNLNGRPVELPLLARLNAEIAHRGADGEGFWYEGPVGLAHQMFRITPESLDETQPFASSGLVIVFDGRLDNREEILALVDGVTAGSPDCALVVAAYRRYGDSTPEKLNGDFAFAIWDSGRQQLLLARDGIGICPLYYCRAGNTFLFGSEIKPILAHPDVSTRPNEETLADWVLRFPGEDNRGTTFFEGIYSVPPAHQATVSQAGVSVRRYWDFDKMGKIRMSGFEEYTEAFRHYFDQAVRRRLRSASPVTVSLSGGVDSSAVYCWAETLRRASPRSIPEVKGIHQTYPARSQADEEAYIFEIETKYESRVSRVPVVLRGPVHGAEEEVSRQECPITNVQWSMQRAYYTAVKNAGARLILNGFFADELMASDVYPVDYLIQGQWRSLWSYARCNPVSFRRKFLRRAVSLLAPRSLTRRVNRLRPRMKSPEWDCGMFTNSFRSRIRQRESAWDASPGPYSSGHAASLYRRVRSRYFVFAFESVSRSVAHHGLEWANPYLDRDLLNFLMAIPGDMVSIIPLKKRLLRSAMQEVVPPAITSRLTKTHVGELVNPVFREDYEKGLLPRLTRQGKLFSYDLIDPVLLSNRSQQDFKLMHGRNFNLARQYCDILALEVWLDAFF